MINCHPSSLGENKMNKEQIYKLCSPYTITSKERVFALCDLVENIVKDNIAGDFIECGTYKGGSVIAMMLALNELKEYRNIHVYDTFEGMTPPTQYDVTYQNEHAANIMNMPIIKCDCSLQTVIDNINRTVSYPSNMIFFHKGDVCKTLPISQHDKIALLRLDTDFYDSTKAELEWLYPKVTENGYTLIDDYGHWNGCRKAVDEYFKDTIFNKIDYTGIFIKKATA